MPTPSSHEQPTAIEIQYDSALMTASSNVDTLLMNDTDWRQSCLFFTAGFLARWTVKHLQCNRCSDALFDNTNDLLQARILQQIDMGVLKTASKGVVETLHTNEKAFIFIIIMPSSALMDILPSQRFIDLHIQTMILFTLQFTHKDLFPTLVNHFYYHELGIETDHNYQ